MGRGAGEAAVKVGECAETFYDTQAFQYGVRDKWGYSCYEPSNDKGHKIFPKKTDSGIYIKPWEFGRHPHDFLKATRAARSNDPYVHYEKGKALERHEKLVAEVESWRQRELLKEQMLAQMTKLTVVERQRQHFQELRRHIQLEQVQWSRPVTSHASSTQHSSRAGSFDGGPSCVPPPRPGSVNLSTQVNVLRGGGPRRHSRQSVKGSSTAPSLARSSRNGRNMATAPSSASSSNDRENMPPIRILSHYSATAKATAELQDLDTFEQRLESLLAATPAPVITTSQKQT